MKNKNTLILSLLLLLSLLALAGCGEEEVIPDPGSGEEEVVSEQSSGPLEAIQKGDAIRDFTVKQVDGSSFTLSEQEGKVVLLNFWATWCGPCVKEMPAFDMLREEYGDQLSILAVSCDTDPQAAKDFLKEQGFGFPAALDPMGSVQALYPTDGIPYSVLIDQNGTVVETVLGGGEAETVFAHYQELIDPLLAE